MKAWHLVASALAGVTLTLVITRYSTLLAADSTGFGDNWDLIFAKVVTVAEMDRIAVGDPVIYQGTQDRWHYFRIGSSGYYRLRTADATIPTHGFEGDGTSKLAGVVMTLTIDNGKLRAGELPAGYMGPEKRKRTFTVPAYDPQDGG